MRLLGYSCLARGHIVNVIETHFIIEYEMKYIKKQYQFISIGSQTLKNDVTS